MKTSAPEPVHVGPWQRLARAVRHQRGLGMVAACLVAIEKRRSPKDHGALTEHGDRPYRYA